MAPDDVGLLQVLFGVPTTQYSHIKEITQNFEPYQQLWTIVYNSSQEYPTWEDGPFQNLDPEDIDLKVTNWTKALHKLAKSLKDEAPGAIATTFKVS